MAGTFFRASVIIAITLLVFTLSANYILGTGAFPISGDAGKDIDDTGALLGETSTLSTPNMDYLWGIIIGGIAAGIIAGALTHSVVPVGIFVYSSVFWASFIRTHSLLSWGGFIPGNFLSIFTIVIVFVFIAAVIGMLTGSG